MRRLIISALFVGVSFFSFFVSIAQATPNLQINYQGKLTDADSLVVADGDYDLVLNLYTASSGGSAIWRMATSTNISNGQFSIMMGASDGSTYALGALSSVNFNQTLYLGVTVGSDSEMTPRKILGMVPAAFEAVKLGGLSSSQFLRSDMANTVTASTTIIGSAGVSANGQPTVRIGGDYVPVIIGAGPSIDFFVGSSGYTTGRIRSYYDGIGSTVTALAFDTGITSPTTKMIIGSSGNVGIGTTSPYAKFSLNAIGGDTNGTIFSVASSTADFATTTHFVILNNGNVGIGTTTPVSTLSVQGSLCVRDTGSCGIAAGTIYATTLEIQDIDLAENFSTRDKSLAAGEIVAVDTDEPEQIKRAQSGDVVLGIISTKPGIALGQEMENSKPVALAGRVPLKVNGEGGAIKIGDEIGLSSVAGIGAKAGSTGSTVGIALGSFNPDSPSEVATVVVFVNLKTLSPVVAGDKISGYFTFNEASGRLKPLASLDLNNQDILNVRSIISANGSWKIDEQGILTTTEVHTTRLCIGATCINENQLQEILQHVGTSSPPNPEPNPEPIPIPIPISTTTPPILEIQPPEPLPEVISPPVIETSLPVPESTPESTPQPEPSPEPALSS